LTAPPTMRIAVLGVGGIGGLLAARLAETAADIILLARGETAAALAIDGLHLEQSDSVRSHHHADRFEIIDTSGVPGTRQAAVPVDIAFICGKSADTASLAGYASELLNGSGFALSLQNGLGHADLLARHLGAQRVLDGSTLHGATRLGPNQVRWAGVGRIDLGWHTPPDGEGRPADPADMDARCERLVQLLDEAGLRPVWQSDMRSVIWQKLLLNIAINPLAAICGVENGAILTSTDLLEQARSTLAEGVLVARAEGVVVDEQRMVERLEEVLAATADNRCSMLQDVMAGRPTEIDALCGEVARRGEALGIPTPRNAQLLALVEGIGH